MQNGQGAMQVLEEANQTIGDADTNMPGAYVEDTTLDPPPVATNADPGPAESLTQRTRRAPVRFRDILPEPPIPVSVPQPRLPMVYLMVTNPLKTAINSFGLFRQYLFHPSYDPDTFTDPGDLSNLTTRPLPPPLPSSNEVNCDPPWPFFNMSVWRLMRWMNTGSSSKSEGEVDRLVNDVLNAPDFRTEDLHNFTTHRENGRLDAAEKRNLLEDGFQATSITIEVPTGELSNSPTRRTYQIHGLYYRKLLNVIKAAFQDSLSQQFHFTPFSLLHRSPITNEEQRVYGELYNSDEFIKEYKHIQNCSPPPPDDPGCKLEKTIAALMFWSDATHLANFGTAKLWPIYLFFGNLSKYIRARPSSGACNHLAYIPSVCVLISQNVYPFSIACSSQIRLKPGFQAGTRTGIPSEVNLWLTADVSLCKPFGNTF